VDTSEELPTVISFCSGYGGIEKGLELEGFEHRVIAYVEIEAYAIANLVAKMESNQLDAAPIYTDLKTFPSEIFRDKVSLITGGYPCQPFSAAGSRQGEKDSRHLWPYIRRHIDAIRPIQCFFENVEGHISLGLSTVVSDLAEDNYRTTWGIFSAEEVGAPHRRKRVYILGDSESRRLSRWTKDSEREGSKGICERSEEDLWCEFERSSQALADSKSIGVQRLRTSRKQKSDSHGQQKLSVCQSERSQNAQWPSEPRLGRVVDGCLDRVDRIRMLGNGVVPQTAAKAWRTLTQRTND
jgi:DNA (cytosine-5)-methyltransferase 1